MATITADRFQVEREMKRGLLGRAYERIVDAQMARARALTRPHLLALDDNELRALGYSREEISRWPTSGRMA